MFINKPNNNILNAFTLAEVLVTLLIIGVIAALTVPQLIANTNDQQLRVLARKTFSDVQQATNILAARQDNIIDFSTRGVIATQYGTVMNYVKEVYLWEDSFATGYKFYKSTSGFAKEMPNVAGYDTFFLSNGVVLNFGSIWPNCDGSSGGTLNTCVSLCVDVNGKSGPNMFGKDYLNFNIVKTNGEYAVIPFGITGDGMTCVAGSVSMATSRGCAAIMISDDPMP